MGRSDVYRDVRHELNFNSFDRWFVFHFGDLPNAFITTPWIQSF
jgi:hypothetical protein